jgi:hypothetical protein
MEFQNYFSEEAIIRELCRARIKHAAKRHDAQFFHNIDRQSTRPDHLAPDDWGNVPDEIFPPRRTWHHYRPKRRGTRAPFATNVETLLRATLALRKSKPNELWAQNLDCAIKEIQLRVLSKTQFQFAQPRIVPIRKDQTSNNYRPLTTFSLPDKIIECLTARYFRSALDGSLLTSCLAFRARHEGKRPPTTHDAIRIIDRVRRESKALYVAECDIQGFFDCVSHNIARDALTRLIVDAKLEGVIHTRALEIFEAYLGCYSFLSSVQNGKEMLDLRKRHPAAHCKWPEDELRKLHKGNQLQDIGVPQGGALSCFIANAVLHDADKALARLERRSGVKITYLRYCDDMILLAPTKVACQTAFDTYARTVRQILLPIHAPKDVTAYDDSLFAGKSNNPYPWRAPTKARHVPWIQFVGYQLRYDGLLRVRRKSIDKHVQRITDVTNSLLSVLDKGASRGGLRRTATQIYYRFHQKLISMSVGRIRRNKKSKGPMPMCWAAGFRGLTGRRFVTTNIQYLDRHRERQLRRVARRLEQLNLPKATAKSEVDALPYYGYPFSYIAQFG